MTPDPGKVASELAARLLETREFLGFTREQVSTATGYAVLRLTALEHGTARIGDGELVRLASFYRRPAGWFRGETDWQPSPGLMRMTEHLDEGDREVVMDFAEWLAGAGTPPVITRAELEATNG
jgi:transcriptional regulator with XRE-family HTH domain